MREGAENVAMAEVEGAWCEKCSVGGRHDGMRSLSLPFIWSIPWSKSRFRSVRDAKSLSSLIKLHLLPHTSNRFPATHLDCLRGGPLVNIVKCKEAGRFIYGFLFGCTSQLFILPNRCRTVWGIINVKKAVCAACSHASPKQKPVPCPQELSIHAPFELSILMQKRSFIASNLLNAIIHHQTFNLQNLHHHPLPQTRHLPIVS